MLEGRERRERRGCRRGVDYVLQPQSTLGRHASVTVTATVTEQAGSCADGRAAVKRRRSNRRPTSDTMWSHSASVRKLRNLPGHEQTWRGAKSRECLLHGACCLVCCPRAAECRERQRCIPRPRPAAHMKMRASASSTCIQGRLGSSPGAYARVFQPADASERGWRRAAAPPVAAGRRLLFALGQAPLRAAKVSFWQESAGYTSRLPECAPGRRSASREASRGARAPARAACSTSSTVKYSDSRMDGG